MHNLLWFILITWFFGAVGLGTYEAATDSFSWTPWVGGAWFLTTWLVGWAEDAYRRATSTGEYSPYNT